MALVNKWANYTPPGERFNFAGFTFPRLLADMACGPDALRHKYATRQVCGPYSHAPTPNSNKGCGFYLGRNGSPGDGQPFTRWAWADEVCRGIRHTGWFTDDMQSDKIRGLVVRLPHGRFLAGWSMGEGMASAVDADLYDDEDRAAWAADDMARNAAEEQRDYEERERERIEQEEREEEERERELEAQIEENSRD